MLTVVLPAYNEEGTIAETIDEVRGVLRDMGAEGSEVLVVDDGSTDATAECAEKAGANVVRHPQNAGYGRSLKDGIAAAQNDTIVICDADGTYPASEIPALHGRYREGFDMVVGARASFHESFLKRVLRLFLKWLVEYSAGQKVPDINSGFRIFDRRAVEPLFPTLCNTFSFTTSLTLAYLLSGRFVAYKPIPYRKRRTRTKVRLGRDALRTLQYIVEALIYYNPIKVFILIAAVCGVGALAGIGAWLVQGSALGLALGVGGLQVAVVVFCLGLLAVLWRSARRD